MLSMIKWGQSLPPLFLPFIFPVVDNLAGVAPAGAFVFEGNFKPLITIDAWNIFGFGYGDILLQMMDNVLSITEPEQLFVSFFPAVEIFHEHIGNCLFRNA